VKYSDEVEIFTYWTNEIDIKTIEDFIKVKGEVFNRDFNYKDFEVKYLNNIYGPSVVVLAYFEDECIGIRAFWRNDLSVTESYQPCDTGVLLNYRGMGVFSRMTKAALKKVNDKVYIYNFPNDNSLEAYKKIGWGISEHKKYRVFNSFKDVNLIDMIESKYLEWLLSSENEKLYYYKIRDIYYLLYRRKYNLYLVVGKIDGNYIGNLVKAKYPILLVYAVDGRFGRGVVTVTKNIPIEKKVPIFKFDTLF